MSDDDLALEVKKLTLLHELIATQLEVMVNEQARQGDLLEDIIDRLEPLRALPALVRTILEHQTPR
jgi:hypothetical protein